MNIDHMLAIEVEHCPQSYACMIVAESNFGPGTKIVYSGDTRPCQNLINYARGGCSLLIHEATMSADLQELAVRNRHTTTAEALEVARQIKPWRTILTHFSCRNAAMPETLPEFKDEKIMVAFDHMRLKLSDFEWAHMYLGVFERLFGSQRTEKGHGRADQRAKYEAIRLRKQMLERKVKDNRR